MTKASQSGLIVDEISMPLLVNGETVPLEPIRELLDDRDFAHHIDVVEALGFELFVKRARVQRNKHIRVRPLFRNWAVVGTLTNIDPEYYHISDDVLRSILEHAGFMVGLCDWRPSSATPGQYGKFRVELERI